MKNCHRTFKFTKTPQDILNIAALWGLVLVWCMGAVCFPCIFFGGLDVASRILLCVVALFGPCITSPLVFFVVVHFGGRSMSRPRKVIVNHWGWQIFYGGMRFDIARTEDGRRNFRWKLARTVMFRLFAVFAIWTIIVNAFILYATWQSIPPEPELGSQFAKPAGPPPTSDEEIEHWWPDEFVDKAWVDYIPPPNLRGAIFRLPLTRSDFVIVDRKRHLVRTRGGQYGILDAEGYVNSDYIYREAGF